MTEFDCGWIEIKRSSQYFGAVRELAIYIDGSKFGGVRNGESKVFELPPGEHSVYVSMDWCKTDPLKLDIQAGQTTVLRTGSEITGVKVLVAAAYLCMPNKMFYLVEESD